MKSDKQELLKVRKQANDLIRHGFRNVLKCSKGKSESNEHRDVKYWIARFCWECGLDFMTEVDFKQGGRADVVILDLGVAFEVLKSETIDKFKSKKYPIITVPVSSKIIEVQLFFDLQDLKDSKNPEYYAERGMK